MKTVLFDGVCVWCQHRLHLPQNCHDQYVVGLPRRTTYSFAPCDRQRKAEPKEFASFGQARVFCFGVSKRHCWYDLVLFQQQNERCTWACTTCDTMLLPDKHYLYASDAVTDGVITNKARENYDQIILEVMATEEKTTDVAQTLMFAGPGDTAGARDIIGGYTTDETPEAMPQTQRSSSCLRDLVRSSVTRKRSSHFWRTWSHRSSRAAARVKQEWLHQEFEGALPRRGRGWERIPDGHTREQRDQGLKCKRRSVRFGLWIFCDPRDPREVFTENDLSYQPQFWNSRVAQQVCPSWLRNFVLCQIRMKESNV